MPPEPATVGGQETLVSSAALAAGEQVFPATKVAYVATGLVAPVFIDLKSIKKHTPPRRPGTAGNNKVIAATFQRNVVRPRHTGGCQGQAASFAGAALLGHKEAPNLGDSLWRRKLPAQQGWAEVSSRHKRRSRPVLGPPVAV